MDKNERRVCWYSTALIVLLTSIPKLLALRENGIIAHYWHFNIVELLLQDAFNLFFCWALFELNLNSKFPLSAYREQKKTAPLLFYNIALFFIVAIVNGILQHALFVAWQPLRVFWVGCFARLGLCGALISILIKIILLIRATKKKDIENEQLKTAYMAAELELLKEQMNPHFLFNSLSSLSGVIRENPTLAQKYLRDLSNVFRYSLTHSKVNLVTLADELLMLQSFAQLIHMRLEKAFQLDIDVDKQYLNYKLPHLSLQPLLENAVKHNAATLSNPLKVNIKTGDCHLVVTNTLREIPVPESSNGLGLVNLNERFKIMMGGEIEIDRDSKYFIVKLPLKP